MILASSALSTYLRGALLLIQRILQLSVSNCITFQHLNYAKSVNKSVFRVSSRGRSRRGVWLDNKHNLGEEGDACMHVWEHIGKRNRVKEDIGRFLNWRNIVFSPKHILLRAGNPYDWCLRSYFHANLYSHVGEASEVFSPFSHASRTCSNPLFHIQRGCGLFWCPRQRSFHLSYNRFHYRDTIRHSLEQELEKESSNSICLIDCFLYSANLPTANYMINSSDNETGSNVIPANCCSHGSSGTRSVDWWFHKPK